MTRSFPIVNATAAIVTLSPTASACGMGALLRARLPSREAGASLRDRSPAPPPALITPSPRVLAQRLATTMGSRSVLYEVRSAGPGLALRKANTRRRGGDRGQRGPTRRRVFRPSSRRLHINLSGVVELNNFGTHVGVPQGRTTGNTVVREL